MSERTVPISADPVARRPRIQKIQAFYPPGSLEPLAARIAQSGALPRIAAQWNIPMEIAMDLAKLALFDTVVLVDDSGSMGASPVVEICLPESGKTVSPGARHSKPLTERRIGSL